MSLRRLTFNILKTQHVRPSICSSIRCSSNLTDNDSSKNLQVTLREKATGLFHQGREIVEIIRNGVKDVLADMFKVLKLMRKVTCYDDGYKLNFEELELMYEFRIEMRRLYPVIFLGCLPFGNCLALPLVIKYPKHFLSHHFWTENQKLQFSKMDHQQRVNMYLPVISDLHNMDAFERCPKWRNVLDTVNSGKTPAYSDLLDCVQLFEGTVMPFSLDTMESPFLTKLLKMHNIKHLFSKFTRLFQHGSLILFTDYQIRSCGGPTTLPLWRLKKFCLTRGVNAHEMNEAEMHAWLGEWVDFTKNCGPERMALILVAPALVTVHHPSNASLLLYS